MGLMVFVSVDALTCWKEGTKYKRIALLEVVVEEGGRRVTMLWMDDGMMSRARLWSSLIYTVVRMQGCGCC